MKILRSFKYIYLSIVFFVCSFNFCAFTSYATVSNDRIVQAHNGVFGSLDYDYSFHSKYFTVVDSSGIPSSTTLNPVFYFNVDDTTFNYVDGSDLVMTILNRGIGLILQPNSASALIQAFLASISSSTYDENLNSFIQGALYDSSHNFLGYCLDDISGRYYVNSFNGNITVPNETVNNVYNFTEYYIDNSSSGYPDFVNMSLDSSSNVYTKLPNDSSLTTLQTVLSGIQGDPSLIGVTYNNQGNITQGYSTNGWTGFTALPDNTICVFNGTYGIDWNTLCNFLDLSKDNYNLYFSDVYIKQPSSNYRINLKCVNLDGSNHNLILHKTSNGVYTTENLNTSVFDIYINTNNIYWFFGHDFTLYKNYQAYQSIVNELYVNNNYYSNKYITYNVNNDNSFVTNNNQIDNSITNNSTLYDDSTTIFYENTDGGYIDVPSISIDIDVIIDDIYPEPDPVVPDDPDDPDNPDNPDDPDSPILDTLLQKIVEFLEAIGAVIAAVISGLLGLFTNVIEALSGITDLIGSVGSFIGSIFNFLPSDLVTVLVAAISLCILAAVIKFIRG